MTWKELRRRLGGERVGRWFVRHGRYFFDRRIFTGVLALLVVFGGLAWWQMGFSQRVVVYSCDEPVPCRNPFRDEMGFCTVKDRLLCEPPVLQPGEVIGDLPGWWTMNFPLLAFFTFLAGFGLNHWLWNGDGRRDL